MPSFSKTFSGLTPAANVVLHWRPSWDIDGDYLQYSNGIVNPNGTYTASFSYDYDVAYTWSLYYGQYGSATTYIDGGETEIVPSPKPQQTCDVSFDSNCITVTVSNLDVGDTAWFYLRETADTTGSYDSYRALSYTRSNSSDSSSKTWMEIVEYGISYTYSVIIQPNNIYLVNGAEFTIDGFEWDTYITQGMSMNTYNKRPAPVTASEWNRLVDLVNKKCNTNISHVSSGDSMIASSGGNIRVVADALGVYVNSGNIITAQFFIDLRDAVNAL